MTDNTPAPPPFPWPDDWHTNKEFRKRLEATRRAGELPYQWWARIYPPDQRAHDEARFAHMSISKDEFLERISQKNTKH